MIDSSARLRSMLEKRRDRAAARDELRIPFVLDAELSERLEGLAAARERVADALSERVMDSRDMADQPGRDVRASGHDLTPDGQDRAALEAELARLDVELAEATAEAKAAIVHLVFRRVDAEDYERILIGAGGAIVESDAKAAIVFHNALTAACFQRVEVGGEDAGVRSWTQFVADTAMSFGELDPIRLQVWTLNRRSGPSVPF